MIEVVEIDGHGLCMLGDLYETLLYFDENENAVVQKISEILDEKCEIQVLKGEKKEKNLIRIKTRAPLNSKQIEAISLENETITAKILPPVLPILTPRNFEVPFGSCEQMLAYNRNRQLSLAELAIEYESARGGVDRDEIPLPDPPLLDHPPWRNRPHPQ